MASGAVRELIAKIKFISDNGSLSKANKAINNLKDKMSNLGNKVNKIRVQIDESGVGRTLANIKSKINNLKLRANVSLKASEGVSGIGSALGGAIGAYGGYLGASQIKDTADEVMNLDGRLRTVTKTEEERLHLESELYAMGQKTRQNMTSLGELYTGIARTSNKMGYSMNQNLRVAETVSKALIVGGASKQASSAVILQLSQALGSGVLQGDELHSLDENASFLMEHVAAYFGTTIGGLKQMGKEGTITSDKLLEALTYASTSIDKEFDKMPMTFGQAMTVMENSWDRFILGAEQKSMVFSTIAKGMAKGFESVSGKMHDFLTLMGTPDSKKMVTITEAETGETKQISETDYFNQKAKQNPEMMKVITTLKKIGEWLDKLDGKTGNMDDQIAGWVETLLKVAAVILPIITALGAVSGLIGILTPVFTMISSIGAAIGGLFEGVTIAFGPLLVVIGLVAAAIYFVYENWETVVSWFEPGIKMMQDGLGHLAKAWENIQPFIEALTPLIKKVAEFIGGLVVGALAILFNYVSLVFNFWAQVIDWVAKKLGGLAETVKWVADCIGGLIDKAAEFIGMKGSIEATNRAAASASGNGGGGGSWSDNSTIVNNEVTVSSAEEAATYTSNSVALVSRY